MTRLLRPLVVFAVAICACASPAFAQGNSHKIDQAVRNALTSNPNASQRVILTARPGSRAALKQTLKSRGATILSENAALNVLTAQVAGGDIPRLIEDTTVTDISTDSLVQTNAKPDAGGSTTAALVSAVRETLGLSSSQYTGNGIGVAVIDSGVKSVADFQGRMVGFYDFMNGASSYAVNSDAYGHGTHVAGLVAGTGASSNGLYKGVAPGVRLIGMRVLDENGQGRTSDVINAITFAIANKELLGIDIINLSLGHPIYEAAASDPLVQAVERATRAGIIVVVAAGNVGLNPTTGETGYAGITSPGNARSAITVGAINTNGTATRRDDEVAPYSSRGPTWFDGQPKPDIVAPGHRLGSDTYTGTTIYRNYPNLRINSNYLMLSGTSMSTGVVSGIVALMLEASRAANGYPLRPSLTPNAVKAILQFTAFRMHDAAGVE